LDRREIASVARMASVDPNVKKNLSRTNSNLFEKVEDVVSMDMLKDVDMNTRLRAKLECIELFEKMNPSKRVASFIELESILKAVEPTSCLENELNKRLQRYAMVSDTETVEEPTHELKLEPKTMISKPITKIKKKSAVVMQVKTLLDLLFLLTKPWRPIELLLFFNSQKSIWALLHSFLSSIFV
jgi:hypothetical protein